MSNVAIEEILNARGYNYGAFRDNALHARRLKKVVEESMLGMFSMICSEYHSANNAPETKHLTGEERALLVIQREALDNILMKIARVINNPIPSMGYRDSWVDIQGYAELVLREIEKINKIHE